MSQTLFTYQVQRLHAQELLKINNCLMIMDTDSQLTLERKLLRASDCVFDCIGVALLGKGPYLPWQDQERLNRWLLFLFFPSLYSWPPTV